ncbi:hypothetical protein [Streptomyces sp. NPDC049813]|uniref:hypothetical protein n=1 Tax=Streptomyces sp. NPDC049813 TaxID=3365597 RepID=UPI003788BAA8
MPAAPPLPEVPTGPEQERRPSRLRLFGLLSVIVLTAALPLAGASAGVLGDRSARPAAPPPQQPSGTTREATEARLADAARDAADGGVDRGVDEKPAGAAAGEPRGGTGKEPAVVVDRPATSLLAGLGSAAAAQCGPQLTSPEGIEAQTCVLRQERETWARTYYRNTTGGGLSAVLTLMAPEGRTVQITCAVGAEDEPGMCETPRGRSRAEPARYAAVAEYAAAGDGPLLLRLGSNSAPAYGR